MTAGEGSDRAASGVSIKLSILRELRYSDADIGQLVTERGC
jgi:hypothetical protein